MVEEKQQWKWGVLTVVLLAVFILVVDTTMMNVAINNLVQDLNTTVGTIQSIIAIYALIMASFMLLGSKIGEIIGRKKAFLGGIVIYIVGTLTAALSVNATMLLIGWAILEGIAAAMMMPSTTTFITNAYSGKDRAVGFAVWGGVAAAGAAFGPILGGVLTTYASWRWGFGIEAIICLVILATAFYLTETKPTMKWKQLDIVGCLLSIASMMLIIQAFLMSQTYGFFKPRLPFVVGGIEIAPLGISIVFWMFLSGLTLFAAFIWWQWRRMAKDKVPLFNPQVLKNWGFNVGILEGVIQNLALAGMLFIFPIYLGNIHGYAAVDIGIFMMPMSLAILVLALGATKLSNYIRPLWMLAGGLALMMVGNIMIKNALGVVGTEPRDLIPGTVVFGLGGGLILSQLTNATMGAVKPRLVPDASGMLNTTKQLGTSMGTAFIGGVLMLTAFTGMVDGLADTPEFEGYDQDEIAIWLADFMDKMKNGEIGEGNFTPEEIENLTRIVDKATADAMGNALDAMTYTLVLGLVLLLGGATIYARQLKKKNESILRGEIDWEDADFDPDEEERFHIEKAEAGGTEEDTPDGEPTPGEEPAQETEP